MSVEDDFSSPSLQWRSASTATFAFIGSLAKSFLTVGVSASEVHGLDGFVKLLEEREDVEKRQKGLLTGTLSCYAQLDLALPLMPVQSRITFLCMHAQLERPQK